MPLEFPAVSQSRVEFWGKPQFTQRGMLIFTILFGFFGLHHFYLRSPQTGLLILIMNILTLGYPYFFDIIQLATKSYEDLQEKGLDLPWSVAGIAQGMWIPPTPQEGLPLPKGPMTNALKRFGRSFGSCEKEGEGEKEKPETNQQGGADEAEGSEEPPNPIWFLLYSLLLPLSPIARLVAGDKDNAVLALLNLTIIPLGFIFFAATIVHEYYMLFMKPADLLYNGIYRIFPFTKFGYAEKGFSPRLTGTIAEEPVCEDDSVFIRVFKALYRTLLPAPIVAAIDTVPATIQTTKEQVIDRGVAVAGQAINTGKKVVGTAVKVADLATQIPSAAAGIQQTIQQEISPNVLEAKMKEKLPISPTLKNFNSNPRTNNVNSNPMNPVPSAPSPVRESFEPTPVPLEKQSGGGLDTKDKIVTGGILALLLGGFVLHTGRSAWNAIQDVRSASDLPPSFHA